VSAASAIIAAVLAKVSAAVPGVTVSRQPRPALHLESFPHAMLAATDYEAERLDFGQELRTWSVSVILVWKRAEPPDASVDGERETAALALEAIAEAIRLDPSLGGAADALARLATGQVLSHPDEPFVYASLVVAASRHA